MEKKLDKKSLIEIWKTERYTYLATQFLLLPLLLTLWYLNYRIVFWVLLAIWFINGIRYGLSINKLEKKLRI